MGNEAPRWNIVDTSTPTPEVVTPAPELYTGDREAHRWNVPPGTVQEADNVWRGPAGPGIGRSVKDFGALGDGSTDDTVAIASCIAAGEGVFFPKGTYIVSDTLSITGDGTRMAGDNAAIKAAANLNDNLILVTADDVTIRDLKLDGNAANQSAGDYTDAVLAATAVDSISILDVEIADAYTTALTILGTNGTSTTNVVIRGCRIHDCGDKAIHFSDIDDLVFAENHVYEWAKDYLGSSSCPGMVIWGGYQGNHNWSVTGNVFTGNATSHFSIESASSGWEVVIEGATFSGNLFDAAGANGSGVSGYFFRTTFSGNTHVNGTGNAPYCGYEVQGQGVVLSGNVIENGGICIGAPANSTCQDFLISGNRISNSVTNGKCISFGYSADTLTNVSVVGNILSPTGTGASEGINAGTYGAAGVISNVLISGNHIIGPDRDNANSACIRVSGANGSTGITVTGNYCWGRYYGVGIFPKPSSYLDEVTVVNNDLRGCWDNVAAADFSTGTCRIYQNIIADGQLGLDSTSLLDGDSLIFTGNIEAASVGDSVITMTPTVVPVDGNGQWMFAIRRSWAEAVDPGKATVILGYNGEVYADSAIHTPSVVRSDAGNLILGSGSGTNAIIDISQGLLGLPAMATGSLPTASNVRAGTCAYDTTRNKPVFSTGAKWVFADGTDA